MRAGDGRRRGVGRGVGEVAAVAEGALEEERLPLHRPRPAGARAAVSPVIAAVT